MPNYPSPLLSDVAIPQQGQSTTSNWVQPTLLLLDVLAFPKYQINNPPALQLSGGSLIGGLGLWPLGKGRRDAFNDVSQGRLARHASAVVLLEAVLGQRMLHTELGRGRCKPDAVLRDASERSGVLREDFFDDERGLVVVVVEDLEVLRRLDDGGLAEPGDLGPRAALNFADKLNLKMIQF